MSSDLFDPATRAPRSDDPQPKGHVARDPAPRARQCGIALQEKLGALLGRPARVLDLAALAPGDDRILDEVGQDAYDLILGLNVETLAGTRGADAVRRLLGDLAQKAGACLVEYTPPVDTRAALPSPWKMFEAFAFVHELTPHETHRLDAQWPACFASNRYWHLGGQIGAFDRFLTEAYPGVHDVHDGTRRYYFGAGLAVKVHRYDHAGLGARNRELLNCEAAFLRNPPPGLSVPPLLLAGENPREGWLVRGYLAGDLLLDRMSAGRRYDAEIVLHDVLAELVALEKSGLYHNDVRPWNVIIGADGHASLIDYGSIVRRPVDCAWPQDIFLSFLIFAREIHSGTATLWPLHRRPWMSPAGLPEAFSRAFWSMLESPPETWSFARLQEDVSRGPAAPVKSGVRAILAAVERHDALADDDRRNRDAAFAAGLAGKDAALQSHASEIARLEGELADTRNGLADARGDLAHARRDLADTRSDLADTRSELAGARSALAGALNRLAENETALTAASAHEAALGNHIAGIAAREAALGDYVAAVHRSTSWRVTAPLRFARRCLDALLRGFKPG